MMFAVSGDQAGRAVHKLFPEEESAQLQGPPGWAATSEGSRTGVQ